MIDWSKLKAGHRDKTGSFEELCSQLAKGIYGSDAQFVSVDDSGGGDGVEFYATFSDGRQWGWQAKFFYPDTRLTDSRKTQIKRSLQIACEVHPDLTDWFLCVPADLTPKERAWFEEGLHRSRVNGRPRLHGTTWTPMAISRIVRRSAYSGTHVIHSSTGEIEREVPSIVSGELQEAVTARLGNNKRYSGGRPVRRYLLRGLIRCAKCGWRYSGLSRKREGRYHFKYACPVATTRRYDPHVRRGGCPSLDALWLEDLVWQDIRGFVENPGEVLERVKEQMEVRHSHTDEFEERLASLTKRLATAHGEKDKYVKLYAAGHLDEEELEIHLLDLKNRISNLKMLIESAEADLASEEQDAAAAKSTAMWLTSLRGNLDTLEEDTEEAWHGRRELVEELVEMITVSRTEDGRAKVHIAYKFAPPVQATIGVTNNKTFDILAGETPIPEALGRL